MISNKLSLNVAKTQSMLVSTKAKRKAIDKSNRNLQVKVKGTDLDVVSKIKYLRVRLNNSLDWKDQVRADQLIAGAALVQLRLIVYKCCKTGLLEL